MQTFNSSCKKKKLVTVSCHTFEDVLTIFTDDWNEHLKDWHSYLATKRNKRG